MNTIFVFYVTSLVCFSSPVFYVTGIVQVNCLDNHAFNVSKVIDYFKLRVIPSLEGKRKGDAGKIAVIGGSLEYTGAPFFTAISALKTGADLVYLITTETAAPVIKSYSPDLIVYPFLNEQSLPRLESIFNKMDVIVIGPGLGREDKTVRLALEIIYTCRLLKKPLVIDADGLFALSRNMSVVVKYPLPGVILTPNVLEENRLKAAFWAQYGNVSEAWYNDGGDYSNILVKGKIDKFFGNNSFWGSSQRGSGRRVGGQGDILAGIVATFWNWAIKANVCPAVPTFVASYFTRMLNEKAFNIFDRTMTSSDMLDQIRAVFIELFPSNKKPRKQLPHYFNYNSDETVD